MQFLPVATVWPLCGHCVFFSGHCVATVACHAKLGQGHCSGVACDGRLGTLAWQLLIAAVPKLVSISAAFHETPLSRRCDDHVRCLLCSVELASPTCSELVIATGILLFLIVVSRFTRR